MKKRIKPPKMEAAMAGMDMLPRLMIDLSGEDTDVIIGMKVGDVISLVVQGKVAAVSQRKSTLGEDKCCGTLDLENYDVDVISNKDFDALVDD